MNINIILKYSFFSTLSIIMNLLTQRFVLEISLSDLKLLYAIASGTIAGFILKYILDRNYIFNDSYANFSRETHKISKYAFFSIFTTGIFWFSELLFWQLYKTDLAREFGAVLGLTIGYYIKYNLDKKYVFRKK